MLDSIFEWDPDKSKINEGKHRISFKQATVLWDDPFSVEIALSYEGEQRHAVIGIIGDRIWAAIITRRHEKIRIISVRRAHKDEVIYYENRRHR